MESFIEQNIVTLTKRGVDNMTPKWMVPLLLIRLAKMIIGQDWDSLQRVTEEVRKIKKAIKLISKDSKIAEGTGL